MRINTTFLKTIPLLVGIISVGLTVLMMGASSLIYLSHWLDPRVSIFYLVSLVVCMMFVMFLVKDHLEQKYFGKEAEKNVSKKKQKSG